MTYRGNALLNHLTDFNKTSDVNTLINHGNRVSNAQMYSVYRGNHFVNHRTISINRGIHCTPSFTGTIIANHLVNA